MSQLFFDDDGKVYLSAVQWTTMSPTKDRFSIFAVEMDITTGRSLTRPVLLRESDLINDCAEGPHIIKRGRDYYLLTAEGGTEFHHRTMIYRSSSPLGPYSPPPKGVNPLVHNTKDDPHVRQTGHADMVEAADGSWWAVLLASRRQPGKTEQIGRETFLIPVEWPEDGWPRFNRGQPVGLTVMSDKLPPSPAVTPWRDDFDRGKWSCGRDVYCSLIE
jgi:beta-xylosidase